MMSISRLKLFLLHLIVSLLVILTVGLFVRYAWFPGAHFFISGGIEGLTLIAPTVLVPTLLTWLVYSVKKTRRHLRCDISVIVLLQLVALLFGLRSMHSNRILVEILTPSGIFSAPTLPDIQGFSPTADIQAIEKLNTKHLHPTPIYVYSSNSGNLNDFYDEFRLQKYQPFFDTAFKSSILDAAEIAREKLNHTEANQQAIDAFSQTHPGTYYYFPVYCKYGKSIKVIDEHFMPVTYLNTQRTQLESQSTDN